MIDIKQQTPETLIFRILQNVNKQETAKQGF